ncbi:hypothetical protein A6769_07470 [Nostoc punctiforme NIES-2108]|uniref:Uncharacterized protein n=1 Tax=Nostoc punctiforme NIES-2108 TaxID=1356359 RepID=A0A367RT33_NOSPU|nr:hypothetical protein A6769_07470 [Nostoc punctiforme NIES-2108]
MLPLVAFKLMSPPLFAPLSVTKFWPLVFIASALLIAIAPPLVVISLVLTSPDAVVKLTNPPAPLNGCKRTFPSIVIPSGTVPLLNAGTEPELILP